MTKKLKKGDLMRVAAKKTRKKQRLSWILWAVAIIVALAVTGGVYLAVFILRLPSPEHLATRQISQSTKIFDRTGEVLLYEIHGEEKRTVVPFETIPEWAKRATLAAEDADFYNEPAFDWKGIVRAFIQNFRAGEITQGGSTISQQLVKNVFLSPEKTYTRKIKELIIAIQLESKYSKEEIFAFYLNQIPYGSNAYGIEAASQTYFGKSVQNLSLPEAATLAAMLKAPSYYSPWGTHTDELLARKEYVLARMAELGFITDEEKKTASDAELDFAPPSLGTIQAPHFALTVRDVLIDTFGEYMVTNGGLKVITTLDARLQKFAEEAAEWGAERNKELYCSANAAIVAQDPKTGQVLALSGSKNYFADVVPEGCTPGLDCEFEGNFNVATQGLRQPGSALKPFVYMTAFEKGYSPKTVVFDVSTEFDARNNPETSYRPQNFDGKFRGPIALENALAQSLNVPAVKALYLAGFDDVLKNLHQFGITSLQERWRYGLSLTLGGGEVKLVDLVNAYATMSQDGVFHKQKLILKVEDSKGAVLEEYRDESKRVIDAQYPRMIHQILSSPELRQPIFGNSNALTQFPGYEIALKTGTTEDHRDAWTVGYTPFLITGVWAGNNNNAPMVQQGSSILAAVPIWNRFLQNALPLFEAESFARPETRQIPNKPMLNGESEIRPVINGRVYPQIHSILFYVDPADPLGRIPTNPGANSQFANWEQGVVEWTRNNMWNFFEYNQPLPVSDINTVPLSQTAVSITNTKPSNGEFVSVPFVVQADIQSAENLQTIELYIDKKLATRKSVSGTFQRFEFYVATLQTQQSTIEIKAITQSGLEKTASLIVFH